MHILPISKREKEVLTLIANEFTSKEIAQKLYISQHTADTHRKNLISKLGVKNTAGMVRVGFQSGWLHCLLIMITFSLSINAQTTLEIEGRIDLEEGDKNVYISKNMNSNDGNANVAIGYQAARELTNGGSNVVVGYWAGLGLEDGGENTYLGAQAGKFNESGYSNVMIGSGAGLHSDGSRNIFIGANSGSTTNEISHSIAIGYNADIACEKCAMIGPVGLNAVNVGIGVNNPSSPLHIKQKLAGPLNVKGITLEDYEDDGIWEIHTTINALAFERNGVIKASINPSTGQYSQLSDKNTKTNISYLSPVLNQIAQLPAYTYSYKSDPENKKTIGFMAQDVQDTYPELVTRHGEYLALSYDAFGVIAIKGIQEIKVIIEQLQKENEALKAEIHDLSKLLK